MTIPDLRWRRVYCLLALAALWPHAAVTAEESGQLWEKTPAAESRRISLLRGLGGLSQTSECSLNPIFWEDIEIQERELSLGLYRVERWVSERNAWTPVDVLSVLIRRGEDEALWLRVGPQEDTGWIKVSLEGNEVSITPRHRELLFRGCSAGLLPAGKTFWTDPCLGRVDCESRFFLWLQFSDVGGQRTPTLAPALRTFERVPLGEQGVARWMLDFRSDQAISGGGEPAIDLAASHRIWKNRIWLAGRPEPIREHVFFPQAESSDRNRNLPAVKSLEPTRAAPLAPPPAGEEQTPCSIRIFAPRANSRKGGWGFNWSWEGLAEANVPSFNAQTSSTGCLNLNGSPSDDFFTVELRNQRLEVRRILNPLEIVSEMLPQQGPHTFLRFGGDSFEVLIAANAFGWANQGLAEFNKIFDWLPGLISNVAIYQAPAFTHACAAERLPKAIYLPHVCPGYDGFVAKGMCGDVVVHELAHEVMGSLVDLATAGQHQEIENSMVDEALAYYFALELQGGYSDAYYAPGCQNDFREVGEGNGRELTEGTLLSALHAMPEPSEDERMLGKLLALSALYGWSTEEDSFLDTFFDFAADKVDLDKETLESICQTLKHHTGKCHQLCPGLCHQLEGAAPVAGNQVEVRGTFLGTKECPSFEVRMLEEMKVISRDPGALPWRIRGNLGAFSFPAAKSPPSTFTLVLKPICLGTAAESKTLRVPALPSRILPPPAEAKRQTAAQMGVVGGRPGSRQLVIGYDNGLMSSYLEAKTDPLAKIVTDRIWPGFSVTQAGFLQGWSTDGRQITTWFAPERNDWTQTIGDERLATYGPATLSPGLRSPLQEDPRLEILELDAFEITLGVWPQHGMKPQILHHPLGREIDPASLEVGLTPAGAVLALTERYTKERRTYGWRDGALLPVSNLAVFPLERPALSFRRDGKEIRLEPLDQDSACKAPPYLRFFGQRLLALTCDGVLASYVLDEVAGLRRDWRTKVAGGLVPIAGARPIQLGNLDGAGDPELVLGPFRYTSEGKVEDKVEIRDLASGRLLEYLLPIVSLQAIRSAPAVINLDDDCCDEVVTLTDQPEVWDPNVGVEACRCPSPD